MEQTQSIKQTSNKPVLGQNEPKTKLIPKDNVIKIIDNILKHSEMLLAKPTVRSAEVRAMINGIKDGIAKL